VWQKSDVVALFDSIWRGFPIGTLLLWERPAQAGAANFGPVSLAVPAADDAYAVVDGQQRISTFVGTFVDATPTSPLFDVSFDLKDPRVVPSGPSTARPWWLPIRVALETKTLLAWARDKDLTDDELDLADAFGGTLRDYRIPASVVGERDEAVLRVVFDRVNSAGKRLSRAQLFHALFAGSGADAATPHGVVTSLERHGFGRLEERLVVQSLLAARGGDPFRDIRHEFDSHKEAGDWYSSVEEALDKVVELFLAEGVPHIGLLPSTFPIPVLAAFFHLHPEPSAWHRRLLAVWCWRTWCYGFSRTGQTADLRRFVRLVKPERTGDVPTEYETLKALLDGTPVIDPPAIRSEFRTNEANSRLALLALSSLHPLSPDGSILDISEAFEKAGSDAVGEFVPGHRTDIGARGFWPPGTSLTGHEPVAVLESHAIDAEAARLLVEGDRIGFVARRRAAIERLVADFLRAKVEGQLVIRPALDDLVVNDDETVAEVA
jgi:hypothetical protein